VRRSQDNSGPNREGQCLKNTFCASFVIADAIRSHWPRKTNGALQSAPLFMPFTPDPDQTPYAARARRAPCTSRRSIPKS
jgi:hypothetical protein